MTIKADSFLTCNNQVFLIINVNFEKIYNLTKNIFKCKKHFLEMLFIVGACEEERLLFYKMYFERVVNVICQP